MSGGWGRGWAQGVVGWTVTGLRSWTQQGCQGPKPVTPLKRSTGVAVLLRTMQRFLADDLDRGRETETVRVVDPSAGVLEVNFMELGLYRRMGSDQRRKVFALVCTAGLRRHPFVCLCPCQTQEDLIEGLEAAGALFGGVFPILLLDNLKAVVKTADAASPRSQGGCSYTICWDFIGAFGPPTANAASVSMFPCSG